MSRTKEFDESVVLDAAMRVFWAKGYASTSIQDLVDQMGIHRRSIYDTFGDKHQLFLHALDHYAAFFQKNLAIRIRPEMTTKEKIREMFLVAIMPKKDMPRGCLIVNTASELSLLDQEVEHKIQKLFAQGEDFLYGLLTEGKESGEVTTSAELHELAAYLHNALVGIRVTAKNTDDQQKLSRIIELSLAAIE